MNKKVCDTNNTYLGQRLLRLNRSFILPADVPGRHLIFAQKKKELGKGMTASSGWHRRFPKQAKNLYKLLIKTKQESLLVTITKGSRIVCRTTVSAQREQDGYRLFRLPEIPITGTALIRPVS